MELMNGKHEFNEQDGVQVKGTKIVNNLTAGDRYIVPSKIQRARWSIVLGNSIPTDGVVKGNAAKRYRKAWADFCRWMAKTPLHPITSSAAMRFAHGQPF